MKKLNFVIKAISHLVFKTNFFKTLYINFKMFPLKTAIRFPICIYGKIIFRSLEGKIVINNGIKFGMIKIGENSCYVKTSVPLSVLTIQGTLIFNGKFNSYNGAYILVAKNAKLILGTKGTYFGSDAKIMCFDNICIGNTVRIAWDCQITDTSFHYIKDIQHNTVAKLTKPVVIGNNIWIGNRTTINKGSIIPDRSIIASNSMVNKDLSSFGEDCMFAGQPVKLKLNNIMRIYDKREERLLDSEFGYSRTHL